MESRKHARFSLKVPVFVSVPGDLLRKTIYLESKDVSGGGVSFETGRDIPLESRTSVVVEKLGDLGQPALIMGRVVYRERVPETDRYIIGIEFTQFVNVTRDDLLARIEDWLGPADSRA